MLSSIVVNITDHDTRLSFFFLESDSVRRVCFDTIQPLLAWLPSRLSLMGFPLRWEVLLPCRIPRRKELPLLKYGRMFYTREGGKVAFHVSLCN